MSTRFSITDTLGSITAEYPEAYRVFLKHGIDFCCGGSRSLEAASDDAGVPADQLLDEILHESVSVEGEELWTGGETHELIAHIVDRYHRPLRVYLERLDMLSEKVLKAHFENHGSTLSRLREVILEFRSELLNHMEKEERILFPMILSGRTVQIGHPIRIMEIEHEDAAKKLSQIRRLTNNFTLPGDACDSFKAYWQELETVDRELRFHIHLENNILFSEVLAN